MSALSITPSSYPLACAAVEAAADNGYLVAAHRYDGYVEVRITHAAGGWRVVGFRVLRGGDKVLAQTIRTHTTKKGQRGLAF